MKQQAYPPLGAQNAASTAYSATPELTDGATSISPNSPRIEIGGDETPDVLLDIFRNEMSLSLPFVVLPKSMKAAELHQERPFLYLTIMCVATRNSALKDELIETAWQQLAEKLYVKNERSLDLLLGALVITNWYILTRVLS